MRRQLLPALVMTLCLTVLVGVVYPLAVSGAAGILFSHKASGSLVEKDGKVVGSSLLGQNFADSSPLRNPVCVTDIFRPDAPTETKARGVTACNSLLESVEGERANDGAKYFFPRDFHIVIDVGEYRGLDEVAVVTPLSNHPAAAADRARPLQLATLEVARNPLELPLGHEWTQLRFRVERITDTQLPGKHCETFDELCINPPLHEQAGPR